VDVLRLIAAGNANKQIADQLSIGEATVKSHVTNILSKLSASDHAHAVTIGLMRGIIQLSPKSRRSASDLQQFRPPVFPFTLVRGYLCSAYSRHLPTVGPVKLSSSNDS
jgi:DNA-binding CsgD family transcriptional regulator